MLTHAIQSIEKPSLAIEKRIGKASLGNKKMQKIEKYSYKI